MPPHIHNAQWWEIINDHLGCRLRPDEIARLQNYETRVRPSPTAFTTPSETEFEYIRRHYLSVLARDRHPNRFVPNRYVTARRAAALQEAAAERRQASEQNGRGETETEVQAGAQQQRPSADIHGGDQGGQAPPSFLATLFQRIPAGAQLEDSETEAVASASLETTNIQAVDDAALDSDNSPIILTPSSRTASMNAIDEILQFHDAREHFEDVDDDEDMGEESEGHIGFGAGQDDDEETDELDEDGMPKAPFNPIAMGLKEINGLAHFRVSSFKPGNGVEELTNDDIERYWQSDGVQPHRMTISFVKRVEIRALRFYVDYTQDESYTPTRINWFAGTSLHDLLPFGTSQLVSPAGWIDVPLTGTGGGEDGNSLMAHVVQMQVVENHQNGKDTHIRGIKIYGFDDQLRAAGATGVGVGQEVLGSKAVFRVDESKDAEENEQALIEHVRSLEFEREFRAGDPSGTASTLDFMEDPVIR